MNSHRLRFQMKHIVNLSLGVLLLLLGGCGFHLRGSTPLPPSLHEIRIDSSLPSDAFFKTLRSTLLSSGVSIKTTGDLPALKILTIQRQSTPGSMGTSTQTREYQLKLTLQYEIHRSDGTLVPPVKTLTAHRTLMLNTNRMLGSTSEEQTLYYDMQEELARRLIDQLAAPAVTTQLRPAHHPKRRN